MLKRYRRFFTSAIGFTFFVVGVTGFIFKFFFKTHPLEQIHGWLGIAMIAAAIFHIVHNWLPLKTYLKELRVLALLVPIILVVVYFSIFEKEDSKKLGPKQIIHKLTEGHLNDIAKAFRKDAGDVIRSMNGDGLRIDNDNETLRDIAHRNQKPPEALLNYFVR